MTTLNIGRRNYWGIHVDSGSRIFGVLWRRRRWVAVRIVERNSRAVLAATGAVSALFLVGVVTMTGRHDGAPRTYTRTDQSRHRTVGIPGILPPNGLPL